MGVVGCFGVMGLSALIAIFVEAFGWYMVYRKPEFQKLKRQIEKTAKELEKKKAEPVEIDDSDKKREKGIRAVQRLEKELGEASKELQTLSTPNKLMVTVIVMVMMLGINRACAGYVVAKLPFVPYSLLQKITHRGLAGNDPTDCSVAFLFALCQAGVKGNIAKLVGVGQPKGLKEPSPFSDLASPYDEKQTKTD